MTDLEFVFEESAWEQELLAKRPGEPVCAARLLTLLEGADEDQVEQAVELLAQRELVLDLSALPPAPGTGAAAERILCGCTWKKWPPCLRREMRRCWQWNWLPATGMW